MPLILPWNDIAVRLFCAVLAGSLLGLNRSEHGRAAGLRTSILVCLAACIAMLQVNLLLPLAGRPPDSFVMNDLMRLPLGILSGMGFIGAGAIVRRNNFVVGVTTAATMWLLTVLGLCFGGGQVKLGLVGTGLAVAVLTLLKYAEDRIKQDRQGRLVVVTGSSGPDESDIRAIVQTGGFSVFSCGYAAEEGSAQREWTCELQWRAVSTESKIPDFVKQLSDRQGVVRIVWTPRAR
jgi:putative Mg2+ transporter-C (MgtC) family protein